MHYNISAWTVFLLGALQGLQFDLSPLDEFRGKSKIASYTDCRGVGGGGGGEYLPFLCPENVVCIVQLLHIFHCTSD